MSFNNSNQLASPDDDFDDFDIEGENEDADDLGALERRLGSEVDEDFFEDPRQFHTLQRVIDVLGAQIDDSPSANAEHNRDSLRNNNPAYRALKKQQRVVDDAIEHMAVKHCADLNSSVVQVGEVARQFSDAVNMVRHLRRQVRDIRDTLGSSNPMASGAGENMTTAAQTAAMSLRELWLKKLECEAVLTLLEKMEIVRSAPAEFDRLIQPPSPCRIGAAVVTLSKAFSIAFQSNVAHVQALQNISMQITDRKQRADQIIWDTLLDVIYLRTGNGVPLPPEPKNKQKTDNVVVVHSGASVASESLNNGMKNPFITKQHATTARGSQNDDDDDDSVSSLFSQDREDNNQGGAKSRFSKMVIPMSVLEAELDLVADEQRCLEESIIVGEMARDDSIWDEDNSGRHLPRYVDHVLALRILVECLAKLGRLDDVQRTLNESLHQEIRKIAQKEQAKTFSKLEKNKKPRRRGGDLRDFRRHLTGLLSSFGCVMIRLSHLTQILRHRISTDQSLNLPSYQDKSTAMRSVLVAAHDLMQKEIKDFLQACLTEEEEEDERDEQNRRGIKGRLNTSNELTDTRGLFSLGITEATHKKDSLSLQPESRATQMQQSGGKFVTNVLMLKTNTTPLYRHSLEFRRSVAAWTIENDILQKELCYSTGEDMTSPSFKMHEEEGAIQFLDDIIKNQLIPVLQHDAINGTTLALERDDAFDPVIDRTLYGRPNSNEPQDVDMCIACQALYNSTGALFLALHRLPKDEKMYLHLVGVLEHAILTFISRVKPRVAQLCNNKMALRMLLETPKEGKEKAFTAVVEKRKAYAQLLEAYADGDLLEAAEVGDADLRDSGMMPLTPSASDTKARNGNNGEKNNASNLDLIGGVEKEEQIFALEMEHLKSVLEFSKNGQSHSIVCCSDEELMKASCLAHSLLKLSSLLESRLKVRMRGSGTFEKTLTSTRALREAIKTIKAHGLKMAKFCRIDMLMQTATRLQKICRSSTIVARDAVRIPSCVNDLGEYLTGASDNLREASGNAVTAYTFSSLEQYIPLLLMQTVRVIARGEGIVARSPLTLNGVEALDRSGSVLYRDLKGATSFDNSYWDDELAAISFERSASFMAMMEVEIEELEAYYRGNHQEFSDSDFALMFNMDGPRRQGDIGRYHILRRNLNLN